MTASQSRKSAHRARRLSIGHDGARSDAGWSSQIVQQFMQVDVTRHSFVSRVTVAQAVEAARPASDSLPAPLKSP